jgi:acetyl/propionyl-CoA carboxylase alpha subunit
MGSVAPAERLAPMTNRAGVTALGNGVYRVEHDGRWEVVYVVGQPPDEWAFWNGHVYHGNLGEAHPEGVRSKSPQSAVQALSAPMPASVVKVLVTPGALVKKGDALIILEAMKMELPLRATGDATVKAVHCREGELVQPETVLVELV